MLPTHRRCWLHQAGLCCVIIEKMGRIRLLSLQQAAFSYCVEPKFAALIHCLGLWQKRHDVVLELTCHVSVFPPTARTKGLPFQSTCFAFPNFFREINQHKTMRAPESPLVCLPQPVCLFSLAAINNWDPRCNEMVMLVRTIPRPASAFRPPALPGDNNFSSPRLVVCMSKAQISAPCHWLWSSPNRRWW